MGILLERFVGNFVKRRRIHPVLDVVLEFVFPIIFKSNSKASAMVGEADDLK